MYKKIKELGPQHSVFRASLAILITGVLSFVAYFGGQVSYLVQTSVIGYPEHLPFDGTVYPIEKVPNWVKLSSEKWNMTYSELSASDLIDIPEYNPGVLSKSTDKLKWGDPKDDAVRNAKITYSVPYMGTYLLDGKENSGSHPAVDIKIPKGTPIYSIANGTVVKAANQSSGFGYHIVVQHNNFPSLENANAKQTVYSSYSHLGSLLVKEGDVVIKGQQIALSGQTGTATTPHLHFQIDNSDAPWHPYWPFTWAEISDAGYDFFSAINAGFGKEKAKSTTINSMKYVQAYLDGKSVAGGSSSSTNSNSGNVVAGSYIPETVVNIDSNPVVVVEDEPVIEVPVVEVPVVEVPAVEVPVKTSTVDDVVSSVVQPEPMVKDAPKLTFDFEVLDTYYIGQKNEFAVFLRDQYGDIYENGFNGDVIVSSQEGLFTAQSAIVRHIDFDGVGRYEGEMKRVREGRDRLKLVYEGANYYSDWFTIKTLDSEVSFSDMDPDDEYYDAVIYLASEGVVSGYPDGTFKPYQTVSRVEALKFIYEGIRETLEEGDRLPFPDVTLTEWYGKYLYTAYSKKVVDGYPDGTFKPTNTVNKAEFYKILFNGMGVEVDPNVKADPFVDVPRTEWFAKYVAYAKELGIIKSSVTKLNAEQGMSRGEIAYAIYKLMLLMK